MKAYIISIGTELTMGELVDTNAPYIAAKLPSLGIDLLGISQIGDDIQSLNRALSVSLESADIVFTTGGLGPTEDDLTRESVAHLMKEDTYVDPKSLEVLKARFAQRNLPMPNVNLKQATLIKSARSIVNTRGTAPGWWVTKQNKTLILMPGPPSEMIGMWVDEIEPDLMKLSRGDITITRSLKTFGVGEGLLNERIAHLFHLKTASLGMYAQSQGVHLRIRATASTEQDAHKLINPVEEEIRSLVGEYIWGSDGEQLEEQLGIKLKNSGLTLATMESCTGGLLAHTITQVPGSSEYFKGGYVTYATDVKEMIGVDQEIISRYGVISPEVAANMAQTIQTHMEADIGIGITGIAGEEPMEGQKAGTVYTGISLQGNTTAISREYPTQRHTVKQRAVTHALLELWNLLKQ